MTNVPEAVSQSFRSASCTETQFYLLTQGIILSTFSATIAASPSIGPEAGTTHRRGRKLQRVPGSF